MLIVMIIIAQSKESNTVTPTGDLLQMSCTICERAKEHIRGAQPQQHGSQHTTGEGQHFPLEILSGFSHLLSGRI